MLESILERLSEAQREAVTHVEGPLLILAGPGSGKTRVVTHRIAYLLARGVSDAEILALTFTNKAADEMRNRLAQLAPGNRVWLGTFHRFCAQQLRRHAPLVGLKENFSILDARESQRVVQEVVEKLQLQHALISPESIGRAISNAKGEAITHHAYQAARFDPASQILVQVYPEYARRLLAANAADFDDLLMHFVTILRENPELRAEYDRRYRFIMVDEYQDTNLTQYSIARALSIDHPNLAVTGDPDQSIYGWRGADLNNILEFEHDFPRVRVVRLERNYRSTRSIVDAAQALIERNRRRKAKTHYSEKEQGPPVRVVQYPDGQTEARSIAGSIRDQITNGGCAASDFAVLYRVNSLSRVLENAFREYGLAFQIVKGVEFYSRQEVRDIISYLQLLNNPANDVALKRIINTPARGIGATTVKHLEDFAEQAQLPLWEACRRSGTIDGIAPRSALQVVRFVALMDNLHACLTHPVSSLVHAVIEDSGYSTALRDSHDPSDQDRLSNLHELVTAAREFEEHSTLDPTLENFLEQTALVNDTDDLQAGEQVTLMTLHAAKGLEFDAVFIVGVEQGLIPHRRRDADADRDEEEERRLLFVGMTRARSALQLSFAGRRSLHNKSETAIPSPFIFDLPRDLIEFSTASADLPAGAAEGLFDPASSAGSGVDDEYCQEPGPDEPYFELDGERNTRRGDRPARPGGGPASISTAAELFQLPQAFPESSPGSAAAHESSAAVDTAGGQAGRNGQDGTAFQIGSWVAHPDYGTGQIVWRERAASLEFVKVRFCDNPKLRRFAVKHSPLRIVAGPQSE
jgi:DNA helicase-2/ATP-dependent DNA helicase PcrA